LQAFATFVFETTTRILQSATEQHHETTSLSACVGNHFAEHSTSSQLPPLQFRILFFGDEGSRCSSLMYRKYLKLKRETCQKYTLGQMVNLLSNDVDRFQDVFLFLHHLWIGPLKLVVGIYYFNLILGNTVTIGFLIFFLFFILQGLSSLVV
jgi:ABC-type multidrug transport system fused ATPase/permease subunit